MIELNINDMKDTERHSSKGNQLKWNPANTETWYKADYIGYEGLTEYMVSHLLSPSVNDIKHSAINPAIVVTELPITDENVCEIACAIARCLSPS